MACELALADETDFPHKGVLDFVDNRVDPATGTLRVRGVFPIPTGFCNRDSLRACACRVPPNIPRC